MDELVPVSLDQLHRCLTGHVVLRRQGCAGGVVSECCRASAVPWDERGNGRVRESSRIPESPTRSVAAEVWLFDYVAPAIGADAAAMFGSRGGGVGAESSWQRGVGRRDKERINFGAADEE